MSEDNPNIYIWFNSAVFGPSAKDDVIDGEPLSGKFPIMMDAVGGSNGYAVNPMPDLPVFNNMALQLNCFESEFSKFLGK